MEQNKLPLGFSFALAQNLQAMQVFANLSEIKRQEILQKTHTVSSKDEMQELVDRLTTQA